MLTVPIPHLRDRGELGAPIHVGWYTVTWTRPTLYSTCGLSSSNPTSRIHLPPLPLQLGAGVECQRRWFWTDPAATAACTVRHHRCCCKIHAGGCS